MAGEIFISYRRADQAKAKLLHALLKQRGVDAWYDALLETGADWRHKTAEALEKAPIFVLLFSKVASESDDSSKELAAATFSKKLVIPVRIENIKPSGAFLYELASRNWFDAYEDTEKKFEELADKLAALVKGGPAAEVAAFSLGAPAAPVVKPASKPLFAQPLVLGGIALAAVALVAVIATTLMGSKPPAADNERTAFFGFTAASADPLASEIATNATEETFSALGVLEIGTAARGDTQGVDLNGQLDKAAALDAGYALGGEVRASGDQVSVNIRLDDVRTRATLWQETMTGGAAQRESLPVLAAGRASTVLKCLIRIRPDIVREDASTLARVTRTCQFDDLYDRQWIMLWRDVEQIAPRASYVQFQLGAGWFLQSAFASDAERPAMLQETRAAIQRRLAIAPADPVPRVGLALVDIASDRPLAVIVASFNTAMQAALMTDDRARMDGGAGSRLMVFNMLGKNAEAARIGRSDAASYPLRSNFSIAYGIALWHAGQKLEARNVIDTTVRRLASLDAWGVRAEMAITDGEDIAPILAVAPPAASVELVACWRDIASAVRATDAAARAAGASRMQACARAGIIPPQVGIPILNLLGQVDAAHAITSQMLKRSNPPGFLYAGRAAFGSASRPMRADPRFLPLMKREGIYQYWLDTKTQPDVCETPEERDIEVCRELRKDQGL